MEKNQNLKEFLKMRDLKKALKYTIDSSKATDVYSLFTELLALLYTVGYSDGQEYMKDLMEGKYED